MGRKQAGRVGRSAGHGGTPAPVSTPAPTAVHRQAARYLLVRFIAVFVVLAVLASLAETNALTRDRGRGARQVVARCAVALTSWLGPEVHLVDGAQIVTGGPTLLVGSDCMAIFATGVFLAGVLAFPATWKDRATGVVTGLVGVAVLNIVRIALLIAFARHGQQLFQFAHDVLMQGFLILFVVPLWVLWARHAYGRWLRTSEARLDAR